MFYIYAYELQFIRQLATACTATDSNRDSLAVHTTQLNARKILTAFTFTMRYIDDVHATNNPFFRHLTYDSQTHEGFHGVYPNCLKLTLTTEALSVNFLDLNVYMGNDTTSNSMSRPIIKTALFDKRRTDVFQGMIFNRFPHVTSALTDRAKLGIVVSQFHRFRRILTDYDNFVTEMSQVMFIMIHRGYTKHSLMQKLRNVLHHWPHLYHAQHGRRSNNKKVILDIKLALDTLLRCTAA